MLFVLSVRIRAINNVRVEVEDYFLYNVLFRCPEQKRMNITRNKVSVWHVLQA